MFIFCNRRTFRTVTRNFQIVFCCFEAITSRSFVFPQVSERSKHTGKFCKPGLFEIIEMYVLVKNFGAAIFQIHDTRIKLIANSKCR